MLSSACVCFDLHRIAVFTHLGYCACSQVLQQLFQPLVLELWIKCKQLVSINNLHKQEVFAIECMSLMC